MIGEFKVLEDKATDFLSVLSSIKIPNQNLSRLPLNDKSYCARMIEVYPEERTESAVIQSCLVEFNTMCKGTFIYLFFFFIEEGRH